MVTSTNKKYSNYKLLQQLKKLITLFAFTAFYITQLFAQNPIGKSGVAGDFEIDANFKVGSLAPKDWRNVLTQSTVAAPGGGFYVLPGRSTVAGENAVWIIDGNSGIGTEKEVLATGSNKNGNNIALGQSPYSIVTVNPSTPQKNDLTNIYARSKIISGHRWIQLAAETRSTDGTSYLDFEYNQAGTNQTATQLIGLGPDAGRTAKKTVNGVVKSGDLLFVVDFSKGGNVPVPEVYEWQASSKSKSGFDWVKLGLPATTYIVTNGSDIETAGENSGFNGDGTASNTTLALQFVEIGVDLTALGIVEDNVCNPNATLTAKTRTSSSYTSELKDFNSFKFALVPPATLDVTAPSAKCEGGSASFEALVVGEGALATNVTWYKVTGTAPNETETPITSGITTNTDNGQKSILTISNLNTDHAGKYRARLSGASCGTPYDDGTLTVNTTATLTALSPQVKCPGTATTATFSTTVGGTGASAANVEWYFGTNKIVHDGAKYTISTSGSTSTLLITGITEADEGNYKAVLTGATCGTPEQSNSLTVNETATMQALSPQVKCPGTATTATFSTTVGGTGASAANVEWYFGTNKIVHDGAKYTISTSGSTSTLLITGITEADEGNYKAVLTGATCGTPEQSNSLTVNPVPTANAGDDPADQCYKTGGNTFVLDGSAENGTPKWEIVSKPANWDVSFVNNIDNQENVSILVIGNSSGGKVVMKLTVTSNATPSCGSADDEVEVEILAQPAGPVATMEPVNCNDKFFKVRVTSPVAGVTYSLRQPGNSNSFTPITATSNNNVVTPVIFEGLVFGDGFEVIASIGDCQSAPYTCAGAEDEEGIVESNEKVSTTTLKNNKAENQVNKISTQNINLEGTTSKVTASPNPFSNKIQFNLTSNISGQASLELYDMLGQKVKTVYRGYMVKGQMQSVEYNVPGTLRTNLVWVFSVGNEKTTGKLMGLK